MKIQLKHPRIKFTQKEQVGKFVSQIAIFSTTTRNFFVKSVAGGGLFHEVDGEINNADVIVF